MLKIGLDLHGLVDKNPELFSEFTKTLALDGHEVHVITGSTDDHARDLLLKAKIYHTHFFSITDHLLSKGVANYPDKKGRPVFPKEEWDRSKAEYCAEHGINIHFDDSDIYHKHFKTPYFQLRAA